MSSSTNYEGTSHQRLQAQERLKCYLPQAAMDELLKHHTRLDYPKDAPIFLQGAPADVTFYVLNGIVKVYCPKGDGDRVLLQLAGPGDILGYIDSLGSERRTQVFEAQALTRCTLALLTREHLRKSAEMLERDSLVRAIELINTAWSAVARWYAVFLGLSFQERLEAVFRELATRFGVKEKRGILLLPELSHMDFAEMIQSSRPMVSRLIGQMIDEGLLGRRGRQYIVTDRLLLDGEVRQGEAMSNGHAASRVGGHGTRALAGRISALNNGADGPRKLPISL
jgi:CRP-like cAMP-binding protein